MWINKSSFECNLNFELIGTLLALAIYNSVLLDLKFPRIIYKKLLGEPATLLDLQEFEPDLFNTLKNIKNMETGLEDLCMTMSISYDNFGAEEVFELVPNGQNIPLTRENRDDFVELYLQWYFNSSIEKQYSPFHTGFYKVISKESIRVSFYSSNKPK
jgi:ubiquitin-protein ligase E3 A